MKTFYGKNGIQATVVCDSVSEQGVRLTTILCDYHRIVHSEQLKHRMFSTSAASSRAIPFAKMSEQLTGMPVSFGKNQSGMQAGEEHNAPVILWEDGSGIGEDGYFKEFTPQEAWKKATQSAAGFSRAFAEAGYHKQVYNRLTESSQMIRVLITSTEWPNFWWLRKDKAADPSLEETARVMKEAYDASTPQLLKAGEYHLPFVFVGTNKWHEQAYYSDPSMLQEFELTLEEAIIVSCARCAAQSFRNTDYDLEKSKQVYDRLVNGDKLHGGALEHVGTPMKAKHNGYHKDVDTNFPYIPSTWQEGVSHVGRDGQLWSGNLRGFIQHRKTLPNENYNAQN